MAVRFKMTPGRILLTKPGYDANSAGLAENQKLFDSNWNFSGALIAAGEMTDPAPLADGVSFLTYSASPLVIPFPSPGYVPAAIVTYDYPNSDVSYENLGFNGFRQESSVFADGSRVYADRIEVARPSRPGGKYLRFIEVIHYRVFGVS